MGSRSLMHWHNFQFTWRCKAYIDDQYEMSVFPESFFAAVHGGNRECVEQISRMCHFERNLVGLFLIFENNFCGNEFPSLLETKVNP